MRMPYTHLSKSLRFKRWSRKGYAAFISIQKAVTIGQLTSSLAERFQKKNISLHNIIGSISGNGQEINDDESIKTDNSKIEECTILPLLTTALPAQMSNKSAYAYANILTLYTYNI